MTETRTLDDRVASIMTQHFGHRWNEDEGYVNVYVAIFGLVNNVRREAIAEERKRKESP